MTSATIRCAVTIHGVSPCATTRPPAILQNPPAGRGDGVHGSRIRAVMTPGRARGRGIRKPTVTPSRRFSTRPHQLGLIGGSNCGAGPPRRAGGSPAKTARPVRATRGPHRRRAPTLRRESEIRSSVVASASRWNEVGARRIMSERSPEPRRRKIGDLRQRGRLLELCVARGRSSPSPPRSSSPWPAINPGPPRRDRRHQHGRRLDVRQRVGGRSGRPPRDTTDVTSSGYFAAVTSAAAAPVLAPKRPIGRSFSIGC